MNESQAWQVVILLGGFVTTLLAGVTLFFRWAMKRMDIKDERYAVMACQDRDKFMTMAETFVTSSQVRTDKLHELASCFEKSIHDIQDRAQEQIGRIVDEQVAVKQMLEADHQRFEEYRDTVSMPHYQAMTDQIVVMTDDLRLIGRAMSKLCEALDIKINGYGSTIWDGHERRATSG